MSSVRKSWILSLLLASGLALSACAAWNTPAAKPTTGRDPLVAEVPDANETVRGEDDPAVVTLDLGSTLQEHRLSAGEDLPGKIVIPTTNLNAVPVTAALQAVLAGTDISLAWDTGALGHRLVTVSNLTGTLPQVVQKICNAAKVFCSYRNGSLDVSDTETFIVGLPPSIKKAGGGGATNTMVETLNGLIGGKVQVDDQGGNIIYTADYVHQNMAHQYLEQLRNGRPLVVLQLYVWEVTLNKENAEGINWTQFDPGIFGPGYAKLALSSTSNFTSLATTAGAMSLGAVTTGKLQTKSLISFLSTQGRLQTISSPQVTFISGSGASLKIGGTQRYISQVGSNSSNVSGTTGTSTSSSTVSTDSIDTGLSIEVDGVFENGVIFANLNLALKNLVSLNPTTSGGLTIDLPSTTDEKVATAIRVRPGDNLVMAGLVSSNDTNTSQGIPLGGARIPTYGDDTLQNRELVIMVKPSVVLFSDKSTKEKATTEAKNKDAGALPSALIIDKDGAQALAMPSSTATPQQVASTPVKPEPMQSAPDAMPTNSIPVAASGDPAPVDRRLMQRGFSHAFDELLQKPVAKPSGASQ